LLLDSASATASASPERTAPRLAEDLSAKLDALSAEMGRQPGGRFRSCALFALASRGPHMLGVIPRRPCSWPCLAVPPVVAAVQTFGTLGRIMGASIRRGTDGAIEPGQPQTLFQMRHVPKTYNLRDAAPDGQLKGQCPGPGCIPEHWHMVEIE
jgi:hypothetical protein